MDFVPLTSDQQRAFAGDGFLVVPNALDAETVDRVLNEADTLAEPFLRKPVIADKPEYNHLDLRRGLLKQNALYSLVSHSPTVSLIVQLLGPNIHLHSTTVIYKRPENPDAPTFRRGWHRDIRMARDLGHEGGDPVTPDELNRIVKRLRSANWLIVFFAALTLWFGLRLRS